MTAQDPLHALPTRRIKPIDGMAVTADVWDEAHEFHRRHQQLHALYGHGPGILGGLEVVASDPPDTSVYIRPGLAVDPSGQTIVLAEALSYDIGGAGDGPLYLLLTYGESLPRHTNGSQPEGAPMYVHSEFGLEAVSSLPRAPHVELARMRRTRRGAIVRNARDAGAPGTDEIDVRFRRQAGLSVATPAGIGLVHLGGSGDRHTRGANYLARAQRAAGRLVWVDDAVALGPGLDGYALLYLVAYSGFALGAAEMNALYAYVQAGGTVFAETCRREPQAASAAETALNDLFSSLGLRLEPLAPGHALLTEPALFAAPPAGYETEGSAGVRVAPGVVLSTADYGCLWQGERRSGAAGREAIRAAHEFGGNLLTLAEARRAA